MSRAPIRMPASIAVAALLSACASAPPAGPAPMTLPAGFVEPAPAGGAIDMPRPDWWTAFGDPTLDALEKSVVV